MDNEKFEQWAEERRQRRAERDARRSDRRDSSERPRSKKERVLHTRISDQLDDSLRRAADEMRVPVSNLVRNVLEDVFTVVETVTENVGDLVSDIIDEADEVRERLGRRKGRRHERDVTPNDPEKRAAERKLEKCKAQAEKVRVALAKHGAARALRLYKRFLRVSRSVGGASDS